MRCLSWFPIILTVASVRIYVGESVAAPSSSCYVIDKNKQLFDFTEWVGHAFEFTGNGSDVVVRFCKDVERRSSEGYVDFGHFDLLGYFVPGSSSKNFQQEYYGGDLRLCENSFDKMGRAAQVDIKCGSCSNQEPCADKYGCICSVSYDNMKCRVFVELAISCAQTGSRVFEGFTVGFHPRSYEVVFNGMTQLGFDKAHSGYSFPTEHNRVSLYLTAVSSLSGLVGKPNFKVYPGKGLDVKLSGSGAVGSPPTTLSPTILDALDTPYEVSISIPVKGYNHVEFSLAKTCEYTQDLKSGGPSGWAIFGVICCVLIVASMVFCCATFIYRTRVEHQHGLDALPGVTILSACLEAVSGPSTTHNPWHLSTRQHGNPYLVLLQRERANRCRKGTAPSELQTLLYSCCIKHPQRRMCFDDDNSSWFVSLMKFKFC